MAGWRKHARFGGRILILGFGSIGQGVLPLLLRHLDVHPGQIEVIQTSDRGRDTARRFGVSHLAARMVRTNFRQLLETRLQPGDFLLNLSVEVSSVELMRLCRDRGALYLDACTEPWRGAYTDRRLPTARRTNHALREAALALRTSNEEQPTAIITLGANPGLVSFFVKQALLDLAGAATPVPASREAWARLAQRLDVRVIHIAERDTQAGDARKGADEFVNTWSVDGFISEALQPAELGWGSHERHFPADGARHAAGSRASIYLERPGASTRVRSWTPLAGPLHAFLITHAESISIADHLTVGDADAPEYRPTVHYAYHPCDDAVLSLLELAGREWRAQAHKRLLGDDIVSGRDELGVLLMGPRTGAYWYGSRLTIEQARALAPCNSATTLQVTASVMAGVVWAIRNPRRGVVEPDDLPFDEMLDLTRPYLGDVVGVASDWTPLAGRGRLFEEPVDRTDPWQFANFRVG